MQVSGALCLALDSQRSAWPRVVLLRKGFRLSAKPLRPYDICRLDVLQGSPAPQQGDHRSPTPLLSFVVLTHALTQHTQQTAARFLKAEIWPRVENGPCHGTAAPRVLIFLM